MFEKKSKHIRKFKQNKISPMNIFDILRPVTIVTYITGFRIFEYPRGHSRPKLSFVYAILLYFLCYAGWYFQRYLVKSNRVLNLQDVIFQIAGNVSHVGLFAILVLGYYHTKSLKLTVKRIHEVDLTLRALGSSPTFHAIYKRMIAIIIFTVSHLVLFLALQSYVNLFLSPEPVERSVVICSGLLFFFGQIIEHMMILEFCLIVRCIYLEFQRVNDLLGDKTILPYSSIAIELLDGKNSKDSNSKNTSVFETSSKLFALLPSSRRLRSELQMTSHEIIRSRRLLQTIRQVHLELYRVSKRISMIYGMQISILMSLSILYTTYFIYSLYATYQQESNRSYFIIFTIIGTCMLCFNNLMKIFTVNYISGKTAKQAQRTNEIVYTFYGRNTDSELQEEMEMFSLQMMHCRLTYSAAGLYSLNCNNICACAGFITTYVVIMIQVTSSIQEEVS